MPPNRTRTRTPAPSPTATADVNRYEYGYRFAEYGYRFGEYGEECTATVIFKRNNALTDAVEGGAEFAEIGVG